MGIGHAGIEFEILIARRVLAEMFADIADSLMRRAHEDANTLVIRDIQDLDDRLKLLEPQRLGSHLFLGHMVDAKELIISEQYALHLIPLLVSNGLDYRNNLAKTLEINPDFLLS